MRIKRTLLKLGVSPITKRLYSDKCLRAMANQLNTNELLCSFNSSYREPIEHPIYAAAVTKSAEVTDDGCLDVDIELLDTPTGKIVKEVIDHVEFKPVMVGIVDENGIVDPDTLIIKSISLVAKETETYLNNEIPEIK